jgi:ATP-binding cassette, subfamily B, bacterial HlyB/CyaB
MTDTAPDSSAAHADGPDERDAPMLDQKGEPVPAEGPRIDTGLHGLVLIARYYRIAADYAQVRHELGLTGAATAQDVTRGAAIVGLKARWLKGQKIARLHKIPLPAIIGLKNGSFACVADSGSPDIVRVIDPATGAQRDVTPEQAEEAWNGDIILVTRRRGVGADPKTFGFQWFLPSIWKYRKPLSQVLVASLFIQIFALATPLFFQLVVDKVLVHQGISTLYVVVIGLVLLGLFDVTLQYLRTYALSHTASRIDVELGARLFEHLMRIPIAYFETRSAGQTVARVRELETIRSFLTGQGVSLVIDLLFTVILIGVLFLYSPLLTLIVVGSIPLYLIVAMLVRPLLRDRINEKFNRGAYSQQFLVESIVGVQTIKAAAVEPMMRSEWEDRLAGYVKTSFQAVMLGNLGQNIIQYINKLTTALLLFFGAKAVIAGDLSVGELIAFNMITGQVTAPILRLSQLWQDFQQVQVSVERLGDILNTVPEGRPTGMSSLPPAKGKVEFKNVVFRYRQGEQEVLKNISIDIPAGQVIGVVGPSGSGKSTLTKLVQRLYTPEQGQVLVDGLDINQVDPSWLRRQIGMVLQENLLFNRTIHDNIAFANPAMPRAHVMQVAQLAGADEFIRKMPKGYDTVIEERGANLSGGQRQRIAIARALATNPRILIFDEATSALDYESEQIIQNNMREIIKGRTAIIISHRLAAVRDCHRIISIAEGRLIEDGTHEELLARKDGPYAQFWGLQHEVRASES